MQLDCPRCGRSLSYEGLAPRYCSQCGLPLSSASPEATRPDGDPHATVPVRGRQAAEEHPAAVGGYRLLRRLGAGGMGTVYEAEQDGSGRRVALKLIRPEFAETPEAVERFRREGRLASSITHPRCVFVLAADEQSGRPYIVMELMPGRNLHDLVTDRGALPVREAVGKILDVIEGLQEAHRHGVIHRDIKPSNCFLDHDNRVKVGDFGLAKSLIGPEGLTRSGAFLGTLLFASPEQIRNEPVSAQTDVYSVCATLYYLLTGVAPFQDLDEDPAATLARTVSDPLVPMRRRRPELPRALDEIVCRGLARPQAQRWPSLEDLRLALLPFVAVSHSLDEVGWRVSAYLCDLLVLVPVELTAQRLLWGWGLGGSFGDFQGGRLVSVLLSLALGLVYFGLLEWRFGCTPGKWLTRLRVRESRGGDRPSLGRACLRATWFYLFKDSGAVLVALVLVLPFGRLFAWEGGAISTRMALGVAFLAALPFVSAALGLALLAVTMRRGNGYRGLHEWLSGTETIRLPAPRPALDVPNRPAPPGNVPAAAPASVGAFSVRAVLRDSGGERVLACEDSALGRPVWVWMRRGGDLAAARRDLAREARPRWLSGGEQGGWRWDAFVGAPGCLLVDLVSRRRRLRWAETLGLLAALAEELDSAGRDGTLPDTLSVMQVWVQRSGRPLLLDTPMRDGAPTASPLGFLSQAAAVALEGIVRPAGRTDGAIRAPLPSHAAELLARLAGTGEPFADLAAARSALEEARDQPAEISRPRRGLQIAIGAAGLWPGLLWMFGLGPLFLVGAYFFALAGLAACESNLEELAPEPAGGSAEQDRREFRRIESSLEADRRRVLRSFSGYLRAQLVAKEGAYRRNYVRLMSGQGDFDPANPRDDLLAMGDDILGGPRLMARAVSEEWDRVLIAFGFWPALWCLWSGVTRGGLALRLAGVALRDRNGRPAPRWRCLWRAAVVWLPVLALLLLSFGLDVGRVAFLEDGPFGDAAAWLAWLAWWQAALLLPAFAWAGVTWPNRGFHDRLAGTYPVPRS